ALGLVAARYDGRIAAVGGATALALRLVLRHDAIDPRKAAAIEPAVARIADLAAFARHEIHVRGAGVDRAPAVAAAELGDDRNPHRGRAAVVDVRVGRAQRTPGRGEPRMEKPQHRQPGARAEGLMDADSMDHDPFGLAVVEADHRDAVAV